MILSGILIGVFASVVVVGCLAVATYNALKGIVEPKEDEV